MKEKYIAFYLDKHSHFTIWSRDKNYLFCKGTYIYTNNPHYGQLWFVTTGIQLPNGLLKATKVSVESVPKAYRTKLLLLI